jgi:glycosyltransferase involved in cell wall biosynthesis
MIQRTIWYVSKYAGVPPHAIVGTRGYFIMEELAAIGHKCVFITSDSNRHTTDPGLGSRYTTEERGNVSIRWIKTLKYSSSRSLKHIFSWLDFELRLWRMPCDDLSVPDAVIISSLSLLTVLNGLWLRRRYRCRLVFEVRDIWPLTLVEYGNLSERNLAVRLLRQVERLGYEQADVVVGTMPNLKEHVTQTLGYERKVHCIPMGVDLALLDAANNAQPRRAERDSLREVFTVAYAGSVGIANALDVLFECASRLITDSSLRFLIIGDGDLLPMYLTKYGALPNVAFLGRLPKHEMLARLQACDLLYFATNPSRVWDYGQSLNKLIDYMVIGKPILGSYSGYPSMINEAKCGSFVAAGDVEALTDEIRHYQALPKAEREALGRAGRRWIQVNRSYRTLGENYLDAIFGNQP